MATTDPIEQTASPAIVRNMKSAVANQKRDATSPIRVLSVLLAPQWGGLQGMIEATTPELIAFGVERLIALPVTSPETGVRLREAGAVVFDCDFVRLRKSLNPLVQMRYLKRFDADVERIREIIRNENVDIVEVAGLFVLQAVAAAKLEQCPIVWQLHSDIGPAWLRALMGRIVSKLASVVMTSGKGLIQNHGGLDAISDKVIPILSPVDLSRFNIDDDARRRVREHYGYADDDVVIGTLGNRTWQKGHELLVEAAAGLSGSYDTVRFLIVGSHVETNSEYYRQKVEEFATRVNKDAPGRVIVDTQRFPANELMNGMDIFALASVAEGASLVTAEAMATGKPVVAADVGSLSDLVLPGTTGYLLPRKAKYFTTAFLSLTDKNLRHELGSNARDLVTERKERAAEAHLRAYRNCV